MGSLTDYLKGFEFQVFGQIGEVLRIPDEKTGDVAFFVRVLARGKTYNFDCGNESEAVRYEKLSGNLCRIFGKLGRRKNTIFGVAKITKLVLQDDPNWRDPSEQEFLSGLAFVGYGILSSKRSGTYAGNTFQKLQVAAFGETFEFANVSDEIYNAVPEDVMFRVRGHGEPRISSVGDGVRGSELVLTLDDVRVDPVQSTVPVPPTSAAGSGRTREAKSA
jgi:hypothetical protein